MKITFIQTADPVRYRQFLEITSKTTREYCCRNGFDYECFIGLKRGNKPWHAALNRIPMIKSLLDSGYQGWILYLDADAFVSDLSFDLSSYLAAKHDVAMVSAPSGIKPPRWWDINNGVFLLNLAHPVGRRIAGEWHALLEAIPEDALNSEQVWGEVADDQALLHRALRNTPEAEAHLFLDLGKPNVINFDGTFIKQILRGTSDLLSRLKRLNEAVRVVLDDHDTPSEIAFSPDLAAIHEEFARALYGVLLGRLPDHSGMKQVLRHLRSGERNFETEMRMCLRSAEFQSKLPQFIERHTLRPKG